MLTIYFLIFKPAGNFFNQNWHTPSPLKNKRFVHQSFRCTERLKVFRFTNRNLARGYTLDFKSWNLNVSDTNCCVLGLHKEMDSYIQYVDTCKVQLSYIGKQSQAQLHFKSLYHAEPRITPKAPKKICFRLPAGDISLKNEV